MPARKQLHVWSYLTRSSPTYLHQVLLRFQLIPKSPSLHSIPTSKSHVFITTLNSFIRRFFHSRSSFGLPKKYSTAISVIDLTSYGQDSRFDHCTQVLQFLIRHFFFSRSSFGLPKKYSSCSKAVPVIDLTSYIQVLRPSPTFPSMQSSPSVSASSLLFLENLLQFAKEIQLLQ